MLPNGIGPAITETKKIKAILTPSKPYLLPDGKTKLTVKRQSIFLGRAGRTGTVQAIVGDSVIDVIPNTEILTNGYLYKFSKPPEFTYGEEREADMIFTIVDSCKLTVESSQKDSIRIPLQALDSTISMPCGRQPIYEMKSIHGKDGQFVSLQTRQADIARRGPSKVLGAEFTLTVVNNFGAKKVELLYGKQAKVTIGPETITLDSSDFVYKTKSLKVRIRTESKVKEAEATILKYGPAPRK